MEKVHVERLHSVEKIYQTLSDPYTKLYFLFLDFILPKVTQINEFFQSDKVIIAEVYDKMEYMYKEILYSFLKRPYIDQNNLENVDPENQNYFLELNVLYLGVKVLNELNSDQLRPDLKQFFLQKCREFLSKLCSELKKRFHFQNNFLKKLTIFKPKNVRSVNQLFSLVNYFQEFKRCVVDDAKVQYIDDEWRLLPKYVFKEKEINFEDDIDKFWVNLYNFKSEGTNEYIFRNVAQFVLNILSLPHSNAQCERVFSQVNLIKTKQRNRLITSTINGSLLASQEVKKNFESCVLFKPNQSMLKKMVKSVIYTKNSELEVIEEEDEFIID